LTKDEKRSFKAARKGYLKAGSALRKAECSVMTGESGAEDVLAAAKEVRKAAFFIKADLNTSFQKKYPGCLPCKVGFPSGRSIDIDNSERSILGC